MDLCNAGEEPRQKGSQFGFVLWSPARGDLSLYGATADELTLQVGVLLAVGLFILSSIWNTQLETLIVLIVLFLRTAQRLGQLQTVLQAVASGQSVTQSYRGMLKKAAAAREKWSGGQTPVFERAIRLGSTIPEVRFVVWYE